MLAGFGKYKKEEEPAEGMPPYPAIAVSSARLEGRLAGWLGQPGAPAESCGLAGVLA